MKPIYLDYAATTPLHSEVVKAMDPYRQKYFGNPSSIYTLGQKSRKAVDEAREKTASLVGCQDSEIIFTGGGTEADNFALRGAAYSREKKAKHIITSSIEHHAVINTCKYLENQGFRVTYLPVDQYGLVDPEEVKKAIIPDTFLISIMYANNETGTVEPLSEIGKIARERKILFHTDAVQAVGKIPVDVEDLKVDLLSLSGHKIYGPKGIGALYIRKGVKISPLIYGGSQEKNLRAGTENVPGIVGLGKACEIAAREVLPQGKYLKKLRNILMKEITDSIGDVDLNGHPTQRLPHILNLSFKFVEGEALLLNLDLKGISAAAGSACTSGSLEASRVLLAMGVDSTVAKGSLRFSLGRENTEEEIFYTAGILAEVVKKLRDMSPLAHTKRE